MRLCGYTRRSTDAQVASPQTQQDAIEDYCAKHGHTLVRMYHEVAITGAAETERRVVLPELVAQIKSKRRDFDGIIVWKTDRLMRNPREQENLLDLMDRYECGFISLMDPVNRDTAAGRFMARVIASANAYEREQTGERIYAHHLSAFKQGKWPGGPPSLGLTWNRAEKRFEPNERSGDVQTIFETYAALNGNAAATAREMNRLGILSQHGRFWSVNTILSVLRNPAYRRQLHFDGMTSSAPHIIPELVDPHLISQADRLLTLAQRRGYAPPTHSPYELAVYTGILTCSLCGAGLTLNGSDRGDRQWYAGYVCGRRRKHGKGVCASIQVSARHIDALMGHALARVLRSIQAEILQTAKHRPPKRRADTGAVAIARAEEARRRTVDVYTRGMIAESDFLQRIEAIDGELARLKDRPQVPVSSLPDQVVAVLGSFAQEWPNVPGPEKRGLLLQIGARGVLCTTEPQSLWLELSTDIVPNRVRAVAARRSKWGVKSISCCTLS